MSEITMENRCYWPCPCGGTVPDAPDHCVFSVPAPKGPGKCVDAAVCLTCCGDRGICEAYQNFKRAIRARRAQDIANFAQRNEREES